MNERDYICYSDEAWFGKLSHQKYLKEDLGGNLVKKIKSVKKYQKAEKKYKKELNPLKKNNHNQYRMTKFTCSWRDLKNIKNISLKFIKYDWSSSNIYRSNYDSSLSLDGNIKYNTRQQADL